MSEDLINRITYYLSSGGLFNPELADHLAVRNLLIECREALTQPEQEPVAFEKTVCPFCTSEWVTAEQHDRNVDRVERLPLTNGEIYTAYITATNQTLRPQDERLALAFARAIEAAHGIKGEA